MINEEKMRQQGVDWIIHYVNDTVCECCGNTGSKGSFEEYEADIHTHGLFDNHGHYDLCIVLDVGFDSAKRLLNSMGMRIVKENHVYGTGISNDILANDYQCELIKFEHEDKLYIMVPDDQNRLPDDPNCDAPYCHQKRWAEEIYKDNMRNHLEGTHPEDL